MRDVADGYIWGRGAVDMKDLVAMELSVMRLLAAEARAAGRDPATDPVPGLTRDVLFACDRRRGGRRPRRDRGLVADTAPSWLRAAGAINESGAVATTSPAAASTRSGVAEKGYAVYRITVRGTWGHGSMPRDDNAAVLAAEVVAPARRARVRRAITATMAALPRAAPPTVSTARRPACCGR